MAKRGRPGFAYETLIGTRYGRLTVTGLIPSRGPVKPTQAVCRCDCGARIISVATSLRRGVTRSCGCLQREWTASMGARNKTHGHKTLNNESRTYRTWRAMLKRCYEPKSASYSRYGAKGISVTKPWRDSFASFLNDMGERPAGTSIDRIDNRFGYFPANCRWATPKQQTANRRKPYTVVFPKLKALLDARG